MLLQMTTEPTYDVVCRRSQLMLRDVHSQVGAGESGALERLGAGGDAMLLSWAESCLKTSFTSFYGIFAQV